MPLRIIIAFAFWSLFSGNAFAWEADMHYGLTRWLAANAGFSPEFAECVAMGNQGRDEGYHAPATWATFPMYLPRGEEASKNIQRDHFPSYGHIPNPPEAREVEAGSASAERLAWDAINRSSNTGDSHSVCDSFGQALHALQDSWSHQGIPDTPFRPIHVELSTLAWSHPVARGGWPFHNADITCLYPEDAYQAAKRTYGLMNKFSIAHTGTFGTTAPIPWEEIGGEVKRFANACTKEEKFDWFQSQPNVPFGEFGRQDFLQFITTPGLIEKHGPGILNTTPLDVLSEIQFDPGPEDIPTELRQMLDEFFRIWIIERNIRKVLRHIDINSIRNELGSLSELSSRGQLLVDLEKPPELAPKQAAMLREKTTKYNLDQRQAFALAVQTGRFRLNSVQAGGVAHAVKTYNLNSDQASIIAHEIFKGATRISPDLIAEIKNPQINRGETERWIMKFLTLWHVEDHGLVNARGHGIPFSEGYLSLPEDPKEASDEFRIHKRLTFTRADLRYFPRRIQTRNGLTSYAILFRFRESPRDSIIFIATQFQSDWRISKMMWLAD